MLFGGMPLELRIDTISRMASAAARSLLPAERPVDDDAAGGVMLPAQPEGQNLGALRRIELAAIAADKDFERAVGFLERDRMAHAVIGRHVGNAGDLLIGIAAAHEQRAAQSQRRAYQRGARQHPRGGAAAGASLVRSTCIIVSCRLNRE